MGRIPWLVIGRPPGEEEYCNVKVYGKTPCETQLRGLCTCQGCPEGDMCIDSVESLVIFKNNPISYWQVKTAEIINGVYTWVLRYYPDARGGRA